MSGGGVTERVRALPVWVWLLGVYVLTRLAVLAATATVDALTLSGARCGAPVPRPVEGLGELVGCWDARWYVLAATQGWPATFPDAPGQSSLAFFPGYPLLIAPFAAVGVPALAVGIVISLLAGAAATLVVWRLGAAVAGEGAGRGAAVLFATFPGAVVLSWAYSEALAAALAGLALLLLHRRRWLWAGVAGLAAGTMRADVWVALSIAALVAAVVAWRTPRRPPGEDPGHDTPARHVPGSSLAPWVAVLLTPLGGLAYAIFVWGTTGSPTAWLDVQHDGWNQRMDWGTHAFNTVARTLTDPFASASRAVSSLAVVLFVAGVAAMVARRMPPAWVAYVLVLAGIALSSSQVGFRPRAELLLLPMFVAAGAWLPPRAVPAVAGAAVVVQALVVVLWLGAPGIVPP